VTVTKYRADILTDEIAERISEIASDISEDFGVSIQNVNGGSDHVHILFTAKPATDLTKFVNSLKTSRPVKSVTRVPRFDRRSTARSGNRGTSSQPPDR
jgi:putative transposase